MIIIPYVCAEFHDKYGIVLGKIRPGDLRTDIEVPDSIRQDPLFDMLVRDKSISIPTNRAELKQLENEPEQKIARAGRGRKASQRIQADPIPADEISDTNEEEVSDAKGEMQ